MSNGRSGMRITSAPPAMPEWSAIQPAWRPITSTTRTRLWLSAVVCRRSIASVATCTAVSNPNVTSVPFRSLSIVFGRPSTGTPASCSFCAAPRVSSPPIAISPSSESFSMFSRIRSIPSSRLSGFVRDERRIVPPRGRMPRTASIVRSIHSPSIGPRQPCRKPTSSWPWPSTPLRTIARIAALSPGQSPPPVRTPKRTSATLAVPMPADLESRALPLKVTAVLSLALLAGCGGGGDSDRPEPIQADTLVVYSSLPRSGGSQATGDAVAAGQRLALADAGGRVGVAPIKLVELDSAEPDERDWDPDRVAENAGRAADDPAAIAYLGELELGASAVSLPVTNEESILQVSPTDGLTQPDACRSPGPAPAPSASTPRTRTTSSGSCRRTRRRRARSSRVARESGAATLAIAHDGGIFGRQLAGGVEQAAADQGLEVTTVERIEPELDEAPDLARRPRGGRPRRGRLPRDRRRPGRDRSSPPWRIRRSPGRR